MDERVSTQPVPTLARCATMTDRLDRFVSAQAERWSTILAELNSGTKQGHWMWFVFPQIAGLGRSPTAQYYSISDLAEARAYLAHPSLGPHLRLACEALIAHRAAGAVSVLGAVDAMKLRSSMTLFEAAGGDAVFGRILDLFYDSNRDPATLERLGTLVAHQ